MISGVFLNDNGADAQTLQQKLLYDMIVSTHYQT
jgi:hypothetical protein